MLATASLDNAGLVLATCRHGDFAFYQSDMIGRMLLNYGEWAEQEVRFLQNLLRPGDIAIDIGAHIGTISIPLSKKVGSTGRIFSFEAQRLLYYNLCTNIMLNGIVNIQAINAVVSDIDGHVNLAETPPSRLKNSGGFAIPEGACSGASELFTRKLRLDEFFETTTACRLIKMDIEGHEPVALLGMMSFLARTRPVLYVETNTRERFDRLRATVAALHYEMFWHNEPHFNPGNYRQNATNHYGNKTDLNMVCFPPDWSDLKPNLRAVTSFDEVAHLAAER